MALNNLQQFQETTFSIPRYNDKEVLEKLEAMAQEGGSTIEKTTYHLTFSDQAVEYPKGQDDSDIRELLGITTIAIRQVVIQLGAGIQVRVQRDWQSQGRTLKGTQDSCTIIPGGQVQPQRTAIELAKIIALARKHFKAVDDKPFMDFLDEGTKQLYQSREQDIQRLERMQEEFFGGVQRFTLEQQEKQREFQQELESHYVERQKTLEEQHRDRLSQLEAREAELKKIRTEIDERDNRQARRDIYKELKTKLEQRNQKFELTEGTQNLRRYVWWFTILLLVLFGGGSCYCFYRNVISNETAVNWVAVGDQIALGIAFLGAATFFIRWNHQWFQKHADEEFRLKRLDLDIDRANWLVELTMEWQNITKSEIPHDLTDKLARNLFATDDATNLDIHPAETLFSAIFGKKGSIDIEPGKVTIQRSEGGRGRKAAKTGSE
jgi:hypothetical protein